MKRTNRFVGDNPRVVCAMSDTYIDDARGESSDFFARELIRDIDDLREERNDIEHKKFVLNDQKTTMERLARIVAALFMFANKNLEIDLYQEIGNIGLTEELHNFRLKFEQKFKNAAEKIAELRKARYIIEKCGRCLNDTIAYKKASQDVRCFYCSRGYHILQCENEDCGRLFVYSGCYPYICPECEDKNLPSEAEIAEEQKQMDDWENPRPWDNLPKEDYSELKL